MLTSRGRSLPPIVDYIAFAFTPERRQEWVDSSAGLAVKISAAADDAFTTHELMVDRMDSLGIETMLLAVVDRRPEAPGEALMKRFALDYTELAVLAQEYPNRFAGLAVLNPESGMAGVSRLRQDLQAPWIVGCYIHTHAWDRPLDHRDYYPYYALCSSADVPVVVQAGGSADLLPSQSGHPMGVERAALYFPETRFVLSHLAQPWVDDAIFLARKLENVFIGTGSYPPKYWPAPFTDFIRHGGARKVLFGTNFPTVGHRKALAQLPDLHFEADHLDCLLSANAKTVFRRLAEDQRTRASSMATGD